LPCFAVAAVYSGEQNGLHQMYYFRALSSEIIYPLVGGNYLKALHLEAKRHISQAGIENY